MIFDIFQLVHSLTKAEKRYFQRLASIHVIGEKNNYLKLFEVLNRQKQFNEPAIAKEFSGQHLYLLKRHLQKSLLKSLRTFHSASSVTIQIHTMINEVEVLYKKGLIKAALKLVHHAKKIALRQEQHLAIMQLLEWEIKLLSIPQELVRVHGKIIHAFKEEEDQIEHYKNFLNCFRFRMNVSAMHTKEIIIHKSDEEDEQKKLKNELKKLSARKLSSKAQWELYNGAGTFYSTFGNYAQAGIYHKEAAQIAEKKNFLLRDELRQYFVSFYSESINCYYLKKYDEALGNLKILKNMFSSLSSSANKKNIRELYLRSLLLEGFILMDMGDYKSALPAIHELNRHMHADVDFITSTFRNDFYYQQTGYWFCTGKFHQSYSWLAKMLQHEDAPKENPARYRFARLMQLMILLELNEFREIENLLPATKKFLKKKDKNFKIEESIFDFISGYVRSKELHSEKYQSEKFTELKMKLIRIAKDKKEAAAFQIFDYVKWAEAKRGNKAISQLYVK